MSLRKKKSLLVICSLFALSFGEYSLALNTPRRDIGFQDVYFFDYSIGNHTLISEDLINAEYRKLVITNGANQTYLQLVKNHFDKFIENPTALQKEYVDKYSKCIDDLKVMNERLKEIQTKSTFPVTKFQLEIFGFDSTYSQEKFLIHKEFLIDEKEKENNCIHSERVKEELLVIGGKGKTQVAYKCLRPYFNQFLGEMGFGKTITYQIEDSETQKRQSEFRQRFRYPQVKECRYVLKGLYTPSKQAMEVSIKKAIGFVENELETSVRPSIQGNIAVQSSAMTNEQKLVRDFDRAFHAINGQAERMNQEPQQGPSNPFNNSSDQGAH